MNDAKPENPAETALGCLVMIGLCLWVGSCVFDGSDEPQATPPSTKTVAAPSGPPIASSILEQAILDAAPSLLPETKAANKKASQAADYVGLKINTSGHFCARVLETRKVSWGQYGVACRKHRSGGSATYLIDVRSGSVDEI